MTTYKSWQDIIFDGTTFDTLPYTISKNGVAVYSGVAYQSRPEESDNVEINVSPIVSQMVSVDVPNITTTQNYGMSSKPVDVFALTYESADPIPFGVVYDWSYTKGERIVLADPIRWEVDPRQILTTSFNFDPMFAGALCIITNNDGTEDSFTLEPSAPTEVLATAWVDLRKYPKAKSITISEDKYGTSTAYKVVNNCAKYALYYVNEYGGWDSLVVDGTATKKDDYKRMTYDKPYNNNSLIQRGKTNYLTEITRAYELHTGWILGENGKKMGQLLGSPQVLLYDLEDSGVDAQAVNITNSSFREKTYKTNGGQLVEWTINVETAQRHYRR